MWRKAHELVLSIYRLTRDFPNEERFGLSSQLRRAAISVPANIAEGFGKRTKPDKIRFFNIAQGSLEEVHSYLILTQDLGYGDCTVLIDDHGSVARMLMAYSRAIQDSDS